MMKKKTFTLTENNIKNLEEQANKISILSSALLRRILDEYLKNEYNIKIIWKQLANGKNF